jgi:hypothetical protein
MSSSVTMSAFPPHVLPRGYEYNMPGQYNPPVNTHYTEVRVPEDLVAHMGAVIGKNGFYFKAITQASRVYYIWYNPARKAVEVWGPERRLGNAIGRIIRRFDTARAKLQEQRPAIDASVDAVSQAVQQMEI